MENSEMKQLIFGNGEFNESGFEDFIKSAGEAAASSLVVAIIGPQSSGKSTLMNELFDTNFAVMDAEAGRRKETNGIWMAKAPHIEPLTVVLDLEGTDGKERGEDDTTFEKQSALFALAVADTVIVNMDFKNIGLDHGASRPLLEIIFEVMLSIFSSQKTTLMFVLRDHDKLTKSEKLADQLKEDVAKIWAGVPKPPDHEYTPLSEIFDVKVAVLSHYVSHRHDFDQEVAQLKLELISHPKQENIDLPTSKISLSNAKKTWDMVKENKDLKIPSYRVMVATMRCEEIAMVKLRLFQEDQDWLDLKRNTETRLVEGFGAKTRSILKTYLSEFDKAAKHFEENVRKDKRKYLKSEALKVIHPAFINALNHIRSEAMQSFTTKLKESGGKFSAAQVKAYRESCVLHFNRQYSDHADMRKHAKWEDDALTVRQQLQRETKEHALSLIREQLCIDLTRHILKVIHDHNIKDKWVSTRYYLKSELKKAESAIVNIFEEEHEHNGQIIDDIKKHARSCVHTNSEEESGNVGKLMENRFRALISMESQPTDDIVPECLDILSTMAVIRIDQTYDDVQRVLHSALLGANSDDDTLSSMAWERIPEQMTLITPNECKDIWCKFETDVKLYLENDELKRKMHRKRKLAKRATAVLVSLVGILFLAAP